MSQDDPPRSPKRRRLSPPTDDGEIDFEAAAARALAISLGAEQDPIIPPNPTSQPQPQQNGSKQAQVSALPKLPSPVDCNQQTRLDNLPALDDVATQILSTLAKLSHIEIGEMLFGPLSQRGQDYRALKAKFEQTKKVYLTNSPFVLPAALDLKDAEHIDILRKTNMATFMASIFSGEIGLRIMDMNFLDVFVPDGGRLLKAPASIYLELKTQAFIAAKRTAPNILNQVMLDLFPEDMGKLLVMKRPGAKSLAPSELDFLKRLASRRDILYGDMRHNRLDGLELRYRWDDFSREVNSYLSKNYDLSKEKSDQPSPVPRTQIQQEMEGQFSLNVSESQLLKTASVPSAVANDTDTDFNIDDFMAQAARAAEIALQGGSGIGYGPAQPEIPALVRSPLPRTPPAPVIKPSAIPDSSSKPASTSTPPSTQSENKSISNPVQTSFQAYKPASVETEAERAIATHEALPENDDEPVPHKSQTAPTQVLYERARLVTTNKGSPSSRKLTTPSNRRPWTPEEEHALMTGLDQVKGPHWSQILAMYGPGGTVNESLKDRNQVQLKDKARNLKLFFLKAGIEVPYYLQAVTGDLKTRAPAQLEKREARERERHNLDDDEFAIQQDELQTELIDELDVHLQATTDQEDVREPTPISQAAAIQQPGAQAGSGQISGDASDLEAMIARAAASATQSLGDPWP